MGYGQFLRAKWIADSRGLTLKKSSAEMGVSVSFVSDVEQGRRKPYDEEKTMKLVEFLGLTEADVNLFTEMPKFALLFEFDGNVHGIRHVLYNCNASRPSIASETKEDTIEPVTETLFLTADPRADGLVKACTGGTTTEETYNTGICPYMSLLRLRKVKGVIRGDREDDQREWQRSEVQVQRYCS